MKKLISIFALFISSWVFVFPQIKVDKGIYKAKFSNTLHEPTYVSYILYKGGGDCDRKKFKFINDMPNLQTATDEDYKGSPYDKGHLANAEDFAFNCKKDELTFRYYNCLPQTPNLNRGIWKTIETQVRKWSQTDSLYIICGGYFGNKKIGKAAVPSFCWKVVQAIKSKKVLFCGWFSNTDHATVDSTLSVADVEKKLHSHLTLFN
ncbi:MAG: DNA/RNA non-specific endonuclease [Ignavibacteriales bacterium]|nr:DNA/RNA non-specific endonuclease [Ignavibacteriales bacterium]